MMKTIITSCLIIIWITIGNVTPSFSQSSEQLFRKGMLKEEGEGNLNEAIVIYSKIVDDSTAQISIQAKSLLRVGLCYEKLGRNEASKAYQRLLNNFPGQKAEVAIARERLNRLILNAEAISKTPFKPEMSSKSMTLQKVMSGESSIIWGAISSDGRFLTYSEPKTLNLAIRDLYTGKTSVLTKDAAENPLQFNMGSVISPDCKQIAYAWYKNNHEIWLIDVDNPQAKVLYGNIDEDVFPCAWSPDGKIIYARSILNKTGQCRILAIDAVNGDIQILKTFDNIFWLQLSVSPDNKYIAYDFPNYKNGEFSDTDIRLISPEGKNDVSQINHPANDQILGWFPDKNQLLFKSNRSGSWDAWTIEVFNGKVVGEPRRVLTEIGENASQMGFTKNGTFYYTLVLRKFNGFTAPIDQIKGELKSESANPLLGSIRTAKWSPNGKYIAFIKDHWVIDHRPLYILDLETGKESGLADWLYASYLQWSPDNRNLLVHGYDIRRGSEKEYSDGIYTIKVQSGEVSELLSFSDSQINDGKIGLFWAQTLAEWTKDQKSVYYIRKDQLIHRDIVTGQEEILLQNESLKSNNFVLDLSPDRNNLLFCSEDQIYIIPTIGGKQIPVTKINTNSGSGPTVPNSAVWSPDMSYLFYTQNNGTESYALWRISAEGKNPTTVWPSKVPISSISIHPNGEKIVVTTLEQGAEIWKVDNLLSNEDADIK